ncbi:MAG: putative 60S ribosomal protein L32 [Streblomastix strix]|uniref:Putative 60S ribosomal protein L32 n=1 Tax=Streblomastix strix TaxID=222440 RepID=A0A5J4VFZ6_9EUKA|nr:MAG: putative 60S ribosomal protein L32 [Streblomastix strix]
MTRKVKIIKKKTKRFPRFESDKLKTIKSSWRFPRGIDNRSRRRYRGAPLLPNISYGSSRKTRHMLQNGLFKFIVNNSRDLDVLLLHQKKYAAEIGHAVSNKTRIKIREHAAQLGVKLTNGKARSRKLIAFFSLLDYEKFSDVKLNILNIEISIDFG